jgi:gas vesicle protein GvpN
MNASKLNDIASEENYVVTDYIKTITNRAMLYLNNGFPVHLRGPAGSGKTSLAFHIARSLGKPIMFMGGSEQINDDNLIGGYSGLKKYFIEDNFITSVYKREEFIRKDWRDGRLLTACREGNTVIYDEFTRTPPEINNVLLAILEEKIVDVPYGNFSEYIRVNPDFRIIFTSNPEEYTGVYKSQNALLDRMITIDMDSLDKETEKSIVITKSGLDSYDVSRIIQMSEFIKYKVMNKGYVSIRGSIMLAKVVKAANIRMSSQNPMFRQICADVYNSVLLPMGLDAEEKRKLNAAIGEAIGTIFAETVDVLKGASVGAAVQAFRKSQ